MRKKISGIIACCTMLCLSPFITSIATTEPTGILPPTTITITTPEEGNLYFWGASVAKLPFNLTIVIGPITIVAGVTGINGFEVDFYIDGVHQFHDNAWPFEYPWTDFCFGSHTIVAELYGYGINDSMRVFKIL